MKGLSFDIDSERGAKARSKQDPSSALENFKEAVSARKLSTDDLEKIERAVQLVREANETGKEKNYFPHPLRVALYVMKYGGAISLFEILLALLHNVVEVGSVDPKRIEEGFGKEMFEACMLLCVDRKRQRTSDGEYFREFYSRIARAPLGVRTVKILDKLDNMLLLPFNPSAEVRERYSNEVCDYVLPLARQDFPALVPAFERLIQDAAHHG